jgi:hypothetical protein
MPNWSSIAASVNAAQLRVFGEPITYLPLKGVGDSITESAILLQPSIDQPNTPGYFADIEVDPATPRQRGDKVIWVDGTVYVVNRVSLPPHSNAILALHKQ